MTNRTNIESNIKISNKFKQPSVFLDFFISKSKKKIIREMIIILLDKSKSKFLF